MDMTEPLAWFKSIEVAASARAVHVRDSKDAAGSVLHLSRDAWAGFVGLATAE
ncbi:DUF397 domain-containing protein [Streptomyces sp. NPDC097595]|uniref:DUF397 domain-containing protein n=1 Tax=Streptomyces sp. NPDC097595 TaxID=3366090 RepID=UPI0037FA3E38